MNQQVAKQLGVIAGMALITIGLAAGNQVYDKGTLFIPDWERDFRLSKRLAEIRAATRRYQDVEQARAEGYQQASGNLPLQGYRFYNPEIATFDYQRPSTLLYIQADGQWQLVGLQYALPGARPAQLPFPGAAWKRRLALCRYEDWQEFTSATPEACPAVSPQTQSRFVAWQPDLWVINLWLWHPSPKGLFAWLNPLLAPYDNRTIPPGEERSWAEWEHSAQFSTFNHNVSGWVVLTLGLTLTVLMASDRQQSKVRLLWTVVAVGLGIFILLRSDPEFWPFGGHSFMELFHEREAIEHKLSGVLMLALGTVEWLRRRGTLSHRGWGIFFPWLAMTGGSILLFHIHENVNFNYLGHTSAPHITEGITAILVGVSYLITEWKVFSQWWWKIVPGALVMLVGVQLILYLE